MSFEVTGADYLRKLKQGEIGEAGDTDAHSTPNIEQSQPRASGAERRTSPRYKCQGSVKFRQVGSDVQSWGTFTDVSQHGCYIEVTATFPVNTRLELELEVNGLRADAIGEVRVTYPFLGMGIAFREVREEERARLNEMLRSLAYPTRVVARPPGAHRVAPVSEKTSPVAEPLSEPRHALEALVDFFEKHSTLSREEFYRILRDSHRA